ncbi:60S ribosome biogenesis protein Mak11, putative [Talaromyces stipitatus ATCC 10500]|uniref:60S ribosome biogenesis protein Mak11, putative n=1 Tax=Talaromyces stipitatus (strain ATCC 10500 / CBS 375.48 / QM 6759 / NRRL 1006) TaxID=441959 RepID=B8MKA5_TALSN|nr:60S ribosome biogenesis protein Mak11, putative [Talaromyces stipitatus ATCC 10500]EED15260.1 60S ribosome biogenesis protein Mak11, putative [Talaromyces stipitatus ATCC 10500]
MAKRKRVEAAANGQSGQDQPRKAVKSAAVPAEFPENDPGAVTIQIVTGSYQSVLHGFTVTLPANPPNDKEAQKEDGTSKLHFADTFLFQAHTSAIRTLALSPPTSTDASQPQTAILASGGSDERINLYSLSMAPPIVSERFPSVATLAGNKILENPKNRELGTLLHHSSSITTLYFPSKSKLISAAEDNTISVTRIRDWNVVSTVKAPQPKAQGRPSGDTAPPGSVPCGINDFAVHPSMKLMISVGRGERCMRLWNLMTGKKAGVLNFDKELLQSVKENKRSTGEGRGIVWDTAGEEFAIAFEWGVAIFGIDSTPKCKAVPSPSTKVQKVKYIDFSEDKDGSKELLTVSTDDGSVLFYSTKEASTSSDSSSIPDAQLFGQLGGRTGGLSGRIKGFEILNLSSFDKWKGNYLLVTSGSDGVIRIWTLKIKEAASGGLSSTLLDSYETGNRITCMVAFAMQKPQHPEAINESDLDSDEEKEATEESSSDSDQN